MEFKDYYKTLGVTKTATMDDIKKAYRSLARQYHPDARPNDKVAEQKFRDVTEAYEVLGDPDKRKKYDRLGSDWRKQQRQGTTDPSGAWQQRAQSNARAGSTRTSTPRSGSSDGSGNPADDDFFSEFGNRFGGSGKSSGGGFSDFFSSVFSSKKESEANIPVEITLKEAFAGTHKTITVQGKKIKLSIKPGIENEKKLKIPNPASTAIAPVPDIYVVVTIASDPEFQRDGHNLTTDVSVPLYTAILGGDIELTTLSGKVKIKVAPESQNGSKLRLKGQGMPHYVKPDEHGDLYARLVVQLPKLLTDKERELFKQLAKLRT